MKVLVTGHNGYIGSVMVPVLQAAGHDVMGLDTFFYEDCLLMPDGERIPAVRKDIRDVGVETLEGFDAIVHLAALGGGSSDDLRSEWIYEINHQASVRLARLARDAGVQRFLYASSWSVYGAAAGDDEILGENAPLRPVTPDATSKARTEADVSALANGSFSPTFMRSATAYGLSPRFRAEATLNKLVCWAHTTGHLRIMSDGSPWRPVVHAQDIGRAFAVALAAPREVIHNQAFNVGATGENYQVRELVEIVRSAVPGCAVEYATDGRPQTRGYRVDFGKLSRTLPGFRPHWNASFGAKDLYAALQEAGVTLAEFQGRMYLRPLQIKYLLDLRLLDGSLRWTRAGGGLPASSGATHQHSNGTDR